MNSKRSWINRFFEYLVEKAIFLSGCLTIAFVVLIFVFLLYEGSRLFDSYNIFEFLFGTKWYPISHPEQFGVVPLFLGSILVTIGAIVIAVPLGVAVALFIGEIATGWLKEVLKATVEFLAAIPSIVLGFIGLVTLVPMVRNVFGISTGLTAMSGSIMLAFMAMPTIVSMVEDAITAVPKSYRHGALALGATRWQMIWRVVLPAASSGIVVAVMLGVGRVIGETMAVMMITGNSARIPTSFLQPVRTMTATIAAEMGEAVQGSDHYASLFAIGIVLFIITFAINVIAGFFIKRKKR